MLGDLLFGPRRMPGPQYDRAYTRALVFKDSDLQAALAAGFATALADGNPLQYTWGSSEETDASSLHSGASDIPAAPDAPFALVGVPGGFIQVGTDSPAMILWGNDERLAEVDHAWAMLERSGRPRLRAGVSLRVVSLVVTLLLGAAAIVLPFVAGVTPLGVAIAAVAVASLVWALYLQSAGQREPFVPRPHRIIRGK